MKKMKFTLGLMLSMLFLGANVGYAQPYYYNSALPHSGAIELALYVQGCDYYKSISVAKVAVDDILTGYPVDQSATITTGLPGFDNYAFQYFPLSLAWPYGSGEWKSIPMSYEDQDYFFNIPANRYFTNPGGISGTGSGNLFYYLEKSKTQVYNRLEVELKYTAGNELHPILKRYMFLGQWETVYDIDNDLWRNELVPNGIVLETIITADPVESWFRPDMDRGNGPAKYVYKDQILPLLDDYIITAMFYELAVYDEYDNAGSTVYPIAQPLPQDVRKILIESAEGITTTPNTLGNAIYVPSLKDFVFTAYSESEITAETITLHQPYGDFTEIRTAAGKKGVLVKDNKNGSYTITIQRVNDEMLIRINNEASVSSGDTGNEAFAADAVWAASGTLFVQAATPATLSVFTVTGQLFFQTSVNGSYSMTLPKGLYIVQLNGKAYKVVN